MAAQNEKADRHRLVLFESILDRGKVPQAFAHLGTVDSDHVVQHPKAGELGIPIMLDVLLMVIVGGMGTLYGGLAGAAFLMIAHTFLPDLQNFAKDILPNAHFLHAVLERWLLIFGILFILVVFFFPKGIIGSVQDYAARRKMARSI